MNDLYFAQHPFFSKEYAQELLVKKDKWQQYLHSSGISDLWFQKLQAYYGAGSNGSTSFKVTTGGTMGELSLMKVNDFRSLLQHVLTLITAQRPAGQAKAANTDSKSLRNAKIGTAIAEYYLSQAGYEQKFVTLAEIGLVIDESFLELGWEAQSGDKIAVDPSTQQPVFSGDPTLDIHCPYNVARDVGCNVDSQKWYIISKKVNKWDLIAKYPQYKEHILKCGLNAPDMRFICFTQDNSDYIYVDQLIHDRTPACPNGRYSLFIQDEVLLDVELPFPAFPVERLAPSDVIDGPTGYSSSNDLMGLEQLTDALHSIITTNNITFGVQCLVGPKGAGFNHVEVAKGLRYFELDPQHVDKLRALQLTSSSPEAYNYLNILNQKKGELSGVDSITRGNPEGALKGASGSAMALIQAQSLQFNSGGQRAYFRCLSKGMTKFLELLRVYATSPRIAKLVGKVHASSLKEFKYTGKDLESISSITYEMVNPVSQSIGGRLQMAQDLLAAPGMIKSPKQYVNVLTTGNVEVLIGDDEEDQMNIIEENEYLREGKPVRAIVTENHNDHIKSHMSVIASPTSKQDMDLVSRTLGHIQEHLDMWTELSVSNPALLLATGQQPLPPMPAPPPTSNQGDNASLIGNEGPPPQGPASVVGNGQPPVETQAQGVNEPSMPTIAGTSDKAVVPGVT